MRLVLLAASLAGCLGPLPEEDGAASVGAWRAIDLPIVGLLDVNGVKPGWRAEPWHGWCGATLVAPRVAITAKSCLALVQRPGDVRFSSELGSAVAVAFHHAGAPPSAEDATSMGWTPIDDLTALVLDHDLPVTDAQLRTVRGVPLDPRPRAEGGDVGRAVTFVGYGTNVISPPGGRHAMSSWIAAVADRSFSLATDGDLPCMWDRGDPVFAGAELVGVVSYEFGPPQFDRNGYHVLCRPQPIARVDPHLDVIQRARDDAAARAAAEARPIDP